MKCVYITARERRSAVMHIVVSAAAAALIVVGTGAASVVLAQNDPNASTSGSASPNPNRSPDPPQRLEAPIGHRQPATRDLPPDVRRDEGAVTTREKELDDKLNSICRGC